MYTYVYVGNVTSSNLDVYALNYIPKLAIIFWLIVKFTVMHTHVSMLGTTIPLHLKAI